MGIIQTINPHEFAETMLSPGNYISGNLHLISDRSMMPRLYNPGQPFFTLAGYFLWLVRGSADYILNMIPFHLDCRDVLLIPEHSVMEILKVSEDIEIRLISFHNLKTEETERECFITIDNDSFWERLEIYYSLMMSLAKDGRSDEITIIQHACLKELLKLNYEREKRSSVKKTRGQIVLQVFLSLVNKYAYKERKICFYADKLSLTPNWLSNVVKTTSGNTVMEWITRAVIQKAKLALAYSDAPVYAIADDLYFASESIFSRYFKRETGLTPLEFRKRYYSSFSALT